MLKIDLLPSYFRERRAVRKFMFASAVGLGGVVAAFVFWLMSLNKKLDTLKTTLLDANAKKTEVEKIRADRDAELSAAKPIMDIKNFFVEANAFPPDVEKMLREIGRYTYGRVRILSITPTGAGGGGDAMDGGMASMMAGGAMGSMGGGGMGMMGGRGGGGGGGGGSSGPDITAVLLDCWTDDFRNMMPFINNLKRTGYFTAVTDPSFNFAPVEGGGGTGGGAGGLGGAMGMPAGMAGMGGPGMMSGAMSGAMPGAMGMQGSGGFNATAGGGRPTANLVQSRDGVSFTVTCTLARPLKGAVQPGQQQPAAAAGGMGMMGGMGSAGMMGAGASGASGGAATPAPGENVGAEPDSGEGTSKLGRKADIGGDE